MRHPTNSHESEKSLHAVAKLIYPKLNMELPPADGHIDLKLGETCIDSADEDTAPGMQSDSADSQPVDFSLLTSAPA